MSKRLVPAQIRGARGMLDWSMLDLARAAGMSVSTVKRLEAQGAFLPSTPTGDAVRAALEAAGICFPIDERYDAGIGLKY